MITDLPGRLLFGRKCSYLPLVRGRHILVVRFGHCRQFGDNVHRMRRRQVLASGCEPLHFLPNGQIHQHFGRRGLHRVFHRMVLQHPRRYRLHRMRRGQVPDFWPRIFEGIHRGRGLLRLLRRGQVLGQHGRVCRERVRRLRRWEVLLRRRSCVHQLRRRQGAAHHGREQLRLLRGGQVHGHGRSGDLPQLRCGHGGGRDRL